MVQCKEDLNASRALLVLEHSIKEEWCVCVCVWGRPPSRLVAEGKKAVRYGRGTTHSLEHNIDRVEV